MQSKIAIFRSDAQTRSMEKPSMVRRTFLTAFAAAGIVAVPGKAAAARKGKGDALRVRLQDLGLSQQQADQLQAIRDRYLPLITGARQAARDLRETLRKALIELQSEPQLRAIHDQLSSKLNEARGLRFERALETNRALSREQRQQFSGTDPEEQPL
jgi:Spy/CpxP family protein refolding chaperone